MHCSGLIARRKVGLRLLLRASFSMSTATVKRIITEDSANWIRVFMVPNSIPSNHFSISLPHGLHIHIQRARKNIIS